MSKRGDNKAKGARASFPKAIAERLATRKMDDSGIRLTSYPTGAGTMLVHVALAGIPQTLPAREVTALALAEGWRPFTISADPANEKKLLKDIDALKKAGFFKGFDHIAVLAAGKAAPLAAKVVGEISGAHLILFSPVSLTGAKLRGWAMEDTLFPAAQRATLPSGLMRLRAIGMGEDVAGFMDRENILPDVIRALAGSATDPGDYNIATRKRRLSRRYRFQMEAHLAARGKSALAPAFVKAFRQNYVRVTGAPARRRQAPAAVVPPKPRALGNVWNLEHRDNAMLYLSDQYQGRILGYEERNRITLGQTEQLALGIVALGGPGVTRPLSERFDYHLIDEHLTCDGGAFGAEAQGVALLTAASQDNLALRSVVALSLPLAGMTADDAADDGPLITALRARIATARANLAAWGKTLFIDRIRVDLLSGERTMTEAEAARVYPALISRIRHAVATAVGQASLPTVVLSQGAGLADDGSSEVILAEGRLDVLNPGLGLVVATPSYPFRLMADTMGALDPADQMAIDEIEGIAVATVQRGEPWYCPTMRQVIQIGNQLRVDFATLSPLLLEDQGLENSDYGFRLEGCTNDAKIVAVDVRDARITLAFDHPPTGDALALCYGWGFTGDAESGRPANHGALRDTWEADSLLQPGRVLHRYALAARLPVMPSDLD